MPKVNVEFLINKAYFGDALDSNSRPSSDPSLKWTCLEQKLDEIPDEFFDSIEQEGVKTPICYDTYTERLRNGHHRVLVAFMLGIKELEYIEDRAESFYLEEKGRRDGLPIGRNWL